MEPSIVVTEQIITEQPYRDKGTIMFTLDVSKTPVLAIGPEGFLVRGVKVEQDAEEADVVYFALLEWLTGATGRDDVRQELEKAKARKEERENHGK